MVVGLSVLASFHSPQFELPAKAIPRISRMTTTTRTDSLLMRSYIMLLTTSIDSSELPAQSESRVSFSRDNYSFLGWSVRGPWSLVMSKFLFCCSSAFVGGGVLRKNLLLKAGAQSATPAIKSTSSRPRYIPWLPNIMATNNGAIISRMPSVSTTVPVPFSSNELLYSFQCGSKETQISMNPHWKNLSKVNYIPQPNYQGTLNSIDNACKRVSILRNTRILTERG